MKTKLAENIRKFRKEQNMTQEQLAEAVGVTVGAVHKWEKNLSTPELGLIMELAELFGISTDVLLGYELRSGSVQRGLLDIQNAAKEKRFENAAFCAETLLKKHPNRFDVVYQSAQLYFETGEHTAQKKAYRRAIALLEHARTLLAQNKDETVSDVSIMTQIARAHLMLGDPAEALNILKKFNACGVNNALIGMILGDYFHDADQAEQYLAKAFGSYVHDINAIMVGYANVFFQRKDYASAIDCFLWLRKILRGIQPEAELTYFDKYECVLLETIAECCCFLRDFDRARQYLKAAIEQAVRYDNAPQEEIKPMAFHRALKLEAPPTYDVYGKTAMECLERRIQPEDEGIPHMWELWKEVKQEVMEHEAVPFRL